MFCDLFVWCFVCCVLACGFVGLCCFVWFALLLVLVVSVFCSSLLFCELFVCLFVLLCLVAGFACCLLWFDRVCLLLICLSI